MIERRSWMAGAWASLGAALATRFSTTGAEPARGAHAAAVDPKYKIGTIDLGKALYTHQQTITEAEQVDAWQKSEKDALDAANEAVEALQADLDPYRPGSDEFMALGRRIQLEEFKLRQHLELLNYELEKRRAKGLRDAYTRVQAAAEQVRADLELEVVLQYNEAILSGRTREEAILGIVERTVLVADPQVDITVRVIRILDS